MCICNVDYFYFLIDRGVTFWACLNSAAEKQKKSNRNATYNHWKAKKNNEKHCKHGGRAMEKQRKSCKKHVTTIQQSMEII